MELRDYQKDSVNELRNGFKYHKRQVLCLPTGSGKTVVFSEIVKKAISNGTQTIILTHRTELLKQTFTTVEKLGLKIQVLNAESKTIDSNAILTIAMVETLQRRLKKTDFKPKLIIIDEAHFGNFNKVIDHFKDSFIIGATATPVGKHFELYYTNIVSNIDIPELVNKKFLVDCKAYQMQDDFSDVKVDKGEFNPKDLYSHFDKQSLYNGVIDNWKRVCEGKKTIVFNCNIHHSNNMCEMFNSFGIKSYSITSNTTDQERVKILQDFKESKFLVLNNCGILTTGFDEPSIECVIMNRATKSLPLWLQCCGRGSRLYENKDIFYVLDFGMNHSRHGLWNDKRVWSLTQNKKVPKENIAPVKTCKNCDAMVHASIMVCPYCGYNFPKEKSKIKDGNLVEVFKCIEKTAIDCTLQDCVNMVKYKTTKSSFVFRIIRGKELTQQFAESIGYSNGWVFMQRDQPKEYYKKFKCKVPIL